MKNTFKYALATVLLVVGSGYSLTASPLRRADVTAEPAWVVHLDCDGMRPTALGRFILAEMEKPEAQAKFAAFQSIFSFDPRTQLHGLTLYGTTSAPQDGVLLAYADFDPARLVTLVKAAKEYQGTTYKQHTIHSWIDEKKKARDGVKPRTYAAIHGGRVVIFGQQEARVAQALDVLDGTVGNLSASSAFPALGSTGGSFVQAVGRKLQLPESDPNAAIFRMSRMLSLEVGETSQQLTAQLTLEANDEEVAGHMLSIAQGLLSLMKLQKEKPESVRFAEAVSVKQEGARVLANLALPVDEVVQFLKAKAAQHATSTESK